MSSGLSDQRKSFLNAHVRIPVISAAPPVRFDEQSTDTDLEFWKN